MHRLIERNGLVRRSGEPIRRRWADDDRSVPERLAETEQTGEVVDVIVEVGNGRHDLGRGRQVLAQIGFSLGDHLIVEEALGDLAQDPTDCGGGGILANASRSVLYAGSAEAARAEVMRLRDGINAARG